MNPHIKVTVEGGAHSGKTQVAEAIQRSLAKNKLYGVQLIDDGHTSNPTDGPVKVLVETQFNDATLQPAISVNGPERLLVGMPELKAVLLAWELDRRAGRCAPLDELDRLPAGQVAENSANELWRRLNEGRMIEVQGLL